MNRLRKSGEGRRLSAGTGIGGGKVSVDFVDYSRAFKSPPKRGATIVPPVVVPAGPVGVLGSARGTASPSTSMSRQGGNPYQSPPRKVSLAVELKERITSLQELNNALVTEVNNLQRDKGDLIQRVNLLEVDLKDNADKLASLEEEKKQLCAGMESNREELDSREREISNLTAEKRMLDSEKLALMDRKCELEGQLADAEKKLKESSRRADDAEATVTMAMQELDLLSHKVINKSNIVPSEQTFIADIAKKIELNGLLSCKSILRKEVKRFSHMVLKAKEEVLEAKATIELLKKEQDKWREDKGRLLGSQETAVDKCNQLEKQEKALQARIHELENRVRELEAELRTYKEEKKRLMAETAALAAAQQEQQAAGSCSCMHPGMETIKANIKMLRDNSRRGMEEVATMQKKVAEITHRTGLAPEEQAAVEATKEEMRQRIKQLANESIEAMTKAEEQIMSLRKEVEGLDAAFLVAKDASQQSEHEVWEAVDKLGKESSIIPNIPVGATYLLALGLFAYSLYNSRSP